MWRSMGNGATDSSGDGVLTRVRTGLIALSLIIGLSGSEGTSHKAGIAFPHHFSIALNCHCFKNEVSLIEAYVYEGDQPSHFNTHSRREYDAIRQSLH